MPQIHATLSAVYLPSFLIKFITLTPIDFVMMMIISCFAFQGRHSLVLMLFSF
eukprot:m.244116 g.244116  ORF g.244116 m.244116 type:complete len:53 (-) comp15350_c0_seq5:737-895(-)